MSVFRRRRNYIYTVVRMILPAARRFKKSANHAGYRRNAKRACAGNLAKAPFPPSKKRMTRKPPHSTGKEALCGGSLFQKCFPLRRPFGLPPCLLPISKSGGELLPEKRSSFFLLKRNRISKGTAFARLKDNRMRFILKPAAFSNDCIYADPWLDTDEGSTLFGRRPKPNHREFRHCYWLQA